MGGRAFGPPPHALPERGALVPRVASRVAPVGHSSVQHPGRFQPGKYYPSAVPMAPHSGSGLIGGSSFMGSFLASSLGSPPSHSAPPSGAPHSPSSPSLHSGPHSSPSQIWFPHQAPAGFPQFSGRIAHSFLPISHLDHHGNSSVLYGQHRYYDSQNDPFYLRSLPSQSSLLSANHSFPPVPPTVGSCSHERDSGGGAEVGGGASLHKGLKEGGAELGPAPKEKERPSSKQEARERVQQAHAHLQPRPQHAHLQPRPHHAHPQPRPLHAHPHQLPPLRPAPLQKDTPVARGKPLSACLLNEGGAQGSLSSCGAGVGAGPGMGGEMRISEQPCLERGGNPGGFPCPHPHPSEFYCPPPPPAPSLLTGPTFVPSVAPFGDRSSGPFQLGTPECRGLGAGGGSPGGNAKDRVLEKSGNHGSEGGNHGGAAPTGTCLRKQQQQGYSKAASDWLHTHQQLHVCSKVAPDWLQNHQQQHLLVDKPGPCTGPPPQQNCPHSQPPDGKGVAQFRTRAGGGAGGRVTLQQDVQNVARIRHQPPDPPPWASEGHQPPAGGEEGHRKATRQHGQSEQETGMASPPAPPTCMKSLLRHSSPQPPPPSQSAAFGGLGCLRSRGGAGGRAGGGANCSRPEDRQTLPTRKGSTNEEPRSDLGGRGREDTPHAEGEVRQPPVGIAVAVARQREPPCRPADPHVRPGMGHSALKDVCQGKRRRVCEDALSSPCLERERELFIRENKERIDYSRIHPSSSCHSDLASHLMMVGGTSLHASQLGADPAMHAHAPHHHWMPRTGSPSLWMTGHSYGIGHLHQNLPPGFSAAMPSALQPVLPLPQDPSAQLVVLPTEPPTHPTSHPLEMIDQSGLWPSVFGAQVAHPSVYNRSQFLRQQELYTLQQQQRERVAQIMESQHRHAHSQVQRTLDDPPEPDAPRARPRSPKPAKPFSFTPSPPAGCPTRLSPCCHSPSLRPHPKSTPCPAPCPAPSPATAPRSPALTPTPPHPSLDKRVEGQPPQDYPQSLEPDLPPEYTYSSIGYRRGPSPQDILLAEPADLEAVQVEPTPRPRPLPAVGAEPRCDGDFSPVRHMMEEAEPNAAELREGVEGGGAEKYLGQEGEEPDVIEVCPTLAVTHGDDPPVTCRDGWGEPADEGVVELSDDEEKEEGTAEMETGDEVYLHLCPESTPVPHSTEETRREAVPDDHAPPIPTSCPAPTCQATPTIWSLELLIAAALCGERDTPLQHSAPLPRPAHSMPCPAHTTPCPAHAPPCPGFQGMELLSEVADLELHYHQSSGRGYGKDMLTFDLQSLATLAAARALELGAGEGGGDARRHRVPRRTLNLRRKFSWTPRHDPVSPVKIAMETMDGQEVAMRMQLADLQRRYKEKQKELAKLQRKHEHQKQEPSRSPVRRGPGRPRKRKSTPSAAPTLAPKRARSLGAGLGQLMDDLRGSVSSQRKEKTLSNQVWDQLHTAQSEVPVSVGCMPAQPVFQLLKQKAAANGGAVLERGFHRRAPGPLCTEGKHSSTARGHSNTALAGRGAQEGWVGQMLMLRRNRTKALQTGRSTGKKQEVADTSHTESESSQRVVKLEANQKAKNKKERQGLLGSVRVPCMEEVKVRRRTPYGPAMGTTQKRFLEPEEEEEEEEEEGEEGEGGKRCRQLCQQGSGLQGSLATSRRLKKLTSKSIAQQSIMGQGKGRAVSRLLESFAAHEGFQMDEDSSFSEGEEPGLTPGRMPRPHRETHQVLPSCVLSKEQLVDGLKVLISKEDELLYAAYLRTLDLPDIYSVVIEGERRNRPRIYSLEQLLQEAVLDVRPESELVLEQGARVCAYWSERSRCLYPGYVHRGGPGEQQKEGSVMVEFDDGDRGWISLHNIRLLPPGYQIRCAEPAPTLLMSACRRRRSFTLEKSTLTNTSSDRPYDSTAKPGIPDSVNSGRKCTPSESSCPPLSWLAVTTPRRRTPHSFFPLNGAPRRALKRQEADFSPSLAPPTAPPAKPMFSSSFEVDSFRSIAHGCTSFSARHTPAPLGGGEGGRPCRGGSGCPVKLDHEGVTAPKTKSSKALLQHGGGKAGGAGFGSKGGVSSAVRYAPPVLLTKASKKGGAGGGAQAELLLGGLSQLHAPPQALPMDVLAEYDSDCHSDCHASYSDMEEEEEEEEHQRAAMAGHFLSRLSIFSSSSGSSSSSSSSLCSSSLCSSENDSSYSSEDEEGGPLLLQGCLSSHHALLQAPEPPLHSPPAARHSFGAKVADGNKPIRRKDGPDSTPSAKTPRDPARRQRQLPGDTLPKAGPYPSTHQLWKWSGNPTQRRGMKGKARKLFYKAVVRGRDTVRVGDCAVFLSAGRPHLPYVGRIESMWQSWASNMVVKVKWFYHPEETKMGKRPRDGKHALYQSSHEDENDVQTISHRCQVVSRAEYEYLSRGRKLPHSAQDLYYLAGTYDPASGQLVTAEGEAICC